mmetsp:Transcript_110619/g.253320  ORF Transcript_110619/g.253320 Transcript_110619/m.253320 type:complete len:207 (+) Transcript_110619:2000-2620(+)
MPAEFTITASRVVASIALDPTSALCRGNQRIPTQAESPGTISMLRWIRAGDSHRCGDLRWRSRARHGNTGGQRSPLRQEIGIRANLAIKPRCGTIACLAQHRHCDIPVCGPVGRQELQILQPRHRCGRCRWWSHTPRAFARDVGCCHDPPQCPLGIPAVRRAQGPGAVAGHPSRTQLALLGRPVGPHGAKASSPSCRRSAADNRSL